VLDNHGTHRLTAIQEWLRHLRRFLRHFPPTSAGWLSLVETWFSLLERKPIRRGVFHGVPARRTASQRFLDAWKDHKHPFT